MPKFDVFGPLPHDPELTRLYDMVPGLSPLHALFTVHADALGHERVRMIDDRLVFADPGRGMRNAAAARRHGGTSRQGSGGRQSVARPARPARPLCRYCLAPLENGSAFCSDECEDGAWQIMPTVDGEV